MELFKELDKTLMVSIAEVLTVAGTIHIVPQKSKHYGCDGNDH